MLFIVDDFHFAGLQVILNTLVEIPLFSLFEKVCNSELSKELFLSIHHLIIQQFGLASTCKISGESTEMHKEFKDKEALRDLLAVLLPSNKKAMPTIYTDEVYFTPPEGPGPNGALDLLIGVKVDDTEDETDEMFDIAVLVKTRQEEKDNAVLAESKKSVGDLANRALSLEKPDSSSTLQPIVQFLSVSQLPGFRKQKISLLFYGTRQYLRPYIYYPSQDILLTTPTLLQWKKETGFDLYGTTFVAALLAREVVADSGLFLLIK